MNVYITFEECIHCNFLCPLDLYIYFIFVIGVILWNLPNSKAAGVSNCGNFYIFCLCVHLCLLTFAFIVQLICVFVNTIFGLLLVHLCVFTTIEPMQFT